ncbi:MAG: histidine triad nucleotide-binding protein [Anaerolinea sp.]|nr:histidine triad nucleotide-binding protein [Anaerolinea sp.]
MAFAHPNPSYPIHILIIPKRRIANWLALPVDDPTLYSEYIVMTQGMIRDFCLEETGYRLITNGGKYQIFPHLHIHLVAGDEYVATG